MYINISLDRIETSKKRILSNTSLIYYHTSATDEECCKFLLQMAGGEFLEDGEGDY